MSGPKSLYISGGTGSSMKLLTKNKRMKKITIILILCMCIFSMQGQIKVSASITKVIQNPARTTYSSTTVMTDGGPITSIEQKYDPGDPTIMIYTTIKNNSSEMLKIEDGGIFEPKFNAIIEESLSYAVFSGYSNNSTLICQRQNYPLSLPYGDMIRTIRIKPGESYTTFTQLYSKGTMEGIFDISYEPNIKYLDAKIHLFCMLESMTTMTKIDVTTNRITF